jgi:hypothetical protein
MNEKPQSVMKAHRPLLPIDRFRSRHIIAFTVKALELDQ